MRSNLTVGPPIEVLMYEAESLTTERRYRFEESSEYLRKLNASWDDRLKEAFNNMPPIAWSQAWDQSPASERSNRYERNQVCDSLLWVVEISAWA